MIWRIISLPLTHFAGFPFNTNFNAEGTLNQHLPVAIPAAISVEPIPVEKAPNAPYVQVWESAPITTSPATTNPFSGNKQCSIPISPISKKLTISFSLENSLINLHCSAAFISLFGVKWSGTIAIFSLSNTSLTPNFSNSFTATGEVISFPNTKSKFASINCPAFTLSKPAWAANIFWVIVIAIKISPFKNTLLLFFQYPL